MQIFVKTLTGKTITLHLVLCLRGGEHNIQKISTSPKKI